MFDQEDKIPVGKAEDLTNQLFGNLLVLYRVKSNSGTKWRCQCQCENKTIVDVLAGNLKSGHTSSCGCVQRQKVSNQKTDISIIGQRFGKLTVIEKGKPYKYPNSNKTRNRWKCRCDCGNIVEIDGTSLKRGLTQSCGCLQKQLASQRFTENLVGKRFSRLVVLYRNGSTKQGNAIWHCQCECGNECDVSAVHLKSGDTKSCGCLLSSGAEKIKQLLTQHQIPFETEKTFDACRFPDTKRLARFDFYINQQYIIEFDGLQHYSYSNNGWNNKEQYEKTREHDSFKNQWCKNNNIPLIRIPYFKLQNLTIEDLILKNKGEGDE